MCADMYVDMCVHMCIDMLLRRVQQAWLKHCKALWRLQLAKRQFQQSQPTACIFSFSFGSTAKNSMVRIITKMLPMIAELLVIEGIVPPIITEMLAKNG